MTTLLPVHKIQPPAWMRDIDLVRIMDTLNYSDTNARMVGGCIRNHYLNKPVLDIDIACIFPPNISADLLSSKGIRIIPTGIKHGTITAHINGKNFEITSLRRDVTTDGRHANVEFSNDWIEDAARRDFTINALYADRDGSIYDPLGNGFNDLQNHIVRFIGDPEKRIREDYLRILRFFRFFADYHTGNPHTESLNACADLKDGINTLSDERIFDELHKILMSDNASRAVAAMQSCGIFNIADDAAGRLNLLIQEQNQLNIPCFETRYIATNIDNKYIKNNNLLNFINKINELKKLWLSPHKINVKYALYHYERLVVVHSLLLLKSEGEYIPDLTIADAMTIKPPILPINATDIMNWFKISEGREVGVKLKHAENIWIKSDFTLSHNDIFKIMMNSQT